MALASPVSAPLSARLAPQNLEAERALLGGMLLDNRKIADIMESVPRQAMNFHYFREGRAVARSTAPEAEPLFSHGANQEIFEVIADLYDRERQVDLTTLAEELHRAGRFEAIGGAGYLAGLEEDLLSTLYLPEYLRIVVEKWRLRSLMRAGESIVRDVLRGEQDVLEVLDRSERRIFDLSQQVQSQDFVHVGEIAAHAMAEIEARSKQDDSVTGLPTGFRELDRMTTGLRPSNLIIIAARPSVGKSAFAMNIAARAAVKHNRPVGVFSLEMSAMELNQRLLCTLAGVPLGKLRANRLGRQDMDRLHAQTIRLDKAPLYIDDSSGLSILELRSRSRRLKSRCPNLGLIVVDYLQLMHAGGGRVENRQQEVSLISRALKALSRDLEVPVIALSQLSRASEQRGGRTTRDRMPKLSDLRESGAIEQDADVVVFIHRDFKSKADDDPRQGSEPDLATVRLAKQRNGPVGDFQLLFRGEVTEFVDIHPEAMGAGRR